MNVPTFSLPLVFRGRGKWWKRGAYFPAFLWFDTGPSLQQETQPSWQQEEESAQQAVPGWQQEAPGWQQAASGWQQAAPGLQQAAD